VSTAACVVAVDAVSALAAANTLSKPVCIWSAAAALASDAVCVALVVAVAACVVAVAALGVAPGGTLLDDQICLAAVMVWSAAGYRG